MCIVEIYRDILIKKEEVDMTEEIRMGVYERLLREGGEGEESEERRESEVLGFPVMSDEYHEGMADARAGVTMKAGKSVDYYEGYFAAGYDDLGGPLPDM